MTDQPRWPAGTPVGPSGRGPGGGRFRDDDGPDWAEKLFGEAPPGNRFTRGLMSHDQVAAYIGRTDYHAFGRAGGGMGEVEFREYSDGRRIAVKSVYSENPDEIDSEVDASLVARALGIPVPAVVRDPDRPDTVLMEYLEPRSTDPVDQETVDREFDASRLLGLLDVVIGNSDRHPANVVWTRDGPVGIDHGLAFTKAWHLSPQQRAALRLGGVVPTLDGLTASSVFGRMLFEWEERYEETDPPGALRRVVSEPVQRVFSGEAIREARRRIEPLQDRVQPHHFSGMTQVLDVLEQMSVGGQMLD